MVKYSRAFDLEEQIKDLVNLLELDHIDISRVSCFRTFDSKATNVNARISSMSKVLQKALNIEAHYVIEVISMNFDNLSEEEQLKVLIHELLHIPKTFGGGFRQHHLINDRIINRMYAYYKNKSSLK